MMANNTPINIPSASTVPAVGPPPVAATSSTSAAATATFMPKQTFGADPNANLYTPFPRLSDSPGGDLYPRAVNSANAQVRPPLMSTGTTSPLGTSPPAWSTINIIPSTAPMTSSTTFVPPSQYQPGTSSSPRGAVTVTEPLHYSADSQSKVPCVKPDWVPDNTRTHCHNPNCSVEFSLTKRRHHCRGCGQIFCADCCENKALLPPEFGYNEAQKVCFTCFNIFNPVDAGLQKAIEDTIWDQEGHRERPMFVGWVNHKSPKTVTGKRSKRIVAIGRYRVYAFKPTANSLSLSDHMYDIFDVQVAKAKIVIRFTKNQNRELPLTDLVGYDWEIHRPLEFVNALRTAFRLITLGFPDDIIFPVKASDPETEKSLESVPNSIVPSDPGVAFISTYKAQCNYYRATVNQEVFLYITDLVKAGKTDFNLTDCPGFDPLSKLNYDSQPLIAALYYNHYFTGLYCDNTTDKRAVSLLCNVAKYNRTLTRLSLANLDSGLVSSLNGLGESLKANQWNNIRHINISGNDLGARAFAGLCMALESMQHELITLNIARCGLFSPSMVQLFDVFTRNSLMSLSIEELDLSYNRLDLDGSTAFQNWLVQSASTKDKKSSLRKLYLIACNISVPFVTRGLLSLPYLKEVDIAQNKIEDPASGQMISSVLDVTTTLKFLRVSNCNLPADSVQHVIQAFGANDKVQGGHIDISYNGLSDKGEVLLKPLQNSFGFSILNFAGMKIKDMVFIDLLTVLQNMPTLTTLCLDNCMKSISNEKADEVAKRLGSLITYNVGLRGLSIAGGYQKVISQFLQALTTNSSLIELDISNNNIEDAGALALTVALRDNTSLLYVNCDQNRITFAGYKMLLTAIKNYNRTLQGFEFPWVDYASITSHQKNVVPEIRAVILTIQNIVASNKARSGFERQQYLSELVVN